MQAIDLLFRHIAIDLTRAGEMESFPTQRTLFAQNRGTTKSVAGVQGDRVVEDMENAH
jgi:hypothetical protein